MSATAADSTATLCAACAAMTSAAASLCACVATSSAASCFWIDCKRLAFSAFNPPSMCPNSTFECDVAAAHPASWAPNALSCASFSSPRRAVISPSCAARAVACVSLTMCKRVSTDVRIQSCSWTDFASATLRACSASNRSCSVPTSAACSATNDRRKSTVCDRMTSISSVISDATAVFARASNTTKRHCCSPRRCSWLRHRATINATRRALNIFARPAASSRVRIQISSACSTRTFAASTHAAIACSWSTANNCRARFAAFSSASSAWICTTAVRHPSSARRAHRWWVLLIMVCRIHVFRASACAATVISICRCTCSSASFTFPANDARKVSRSSAAIVRIWLTSACVDSSDAAAASTAATSVSCSLPRSAVTSAVRSSTSAPRLCAVDSASCKRPCSVTISAACSPTRAP